MPGNWPTSWPGNCAKAHKNVYWKGSAMRNLKLSVKVGILVAVLLVTVLIVAVDSRMHGIRV